MGRLGQAGAAPKRETGCGQVAASQPRQQAWAVGLAERGNVQAGSRKEAGSAGPKPGTKKVGKTEEKPASSSRNLTETGRQTCTSKNPAVEAKTPGRLTQNRK
ncbi:hypothetical protein Salat_2884500 [Sesamum alatum]|uniref:Uncharacterized protein n=1 Tax=Sesamum alatum TaxID=300844 RepID=A0AAE1XIA9_9LAMI|nr:hypothetical protein Salat_2884500 [Sesamum alatum]